MVHLGAIRVVLRANGYVVTEVSGAAALDAAALGPFDLMILDLMLQDLEGVEVCRRSRDWSRLPVVVLSAHDEEVIKDRALDGARTITSPNHSARQSFGQNAELDATIHARHRIWGAHAASR